MTARITWFPLGFILAILSPGHLRAMSQLTASDGGAAYDKFGYSVALSGDTALVGSPGTRGDRGSAYVFTFNGTTWVQEAELIPNEAGLSANFGYAIALSGNSALISAPVQRAAFVFSNTGGQWVEQQELTVREPHDVLDYGCSVAISGNTALVGASGSTLSYPGQGAVYLFTFDGAHWSLAQELTASDASFYDGFGTNVAISGDTALIGAYGKSVGNNALQGVVYVFTVVDGSWTQQQELLSGDGSAGDWFGWSVALTGSSAVVGAPSKGVGSNEAQGAAYIFAQSGDTWTQQQEFVSPDGSSEDNFGTAVSLTADTALISAPYRQVGGNTWQGAAYVFNALGGSWTFTQELLASDGRDYDVAGFSVSLDGSTALIGAPGVYGGSNQAQGTAYVFSSIGDRIFRNGFEAASN